MIGAVCCVCSAVGAVACSPVRDVLVGLPAANSTVGCAPPLLRTCVRSVLRSACADARRAFAPSGVCSRDARAIVVADRDASGSPGARSFRPTLRLRGNFAGFGFD